MNKKIIYSTMLELEEDHNLFEINIDGVYVWERIRRSVWWDILRGSKIRGQAHGSSNTKIDRYVYKIINLSKNVFYKNPFYTPNAEILFFGCRRRKQLEDGLWWDIYTDTYLNNLSADYEYLEAAHFGKHLKPTKTDNIRYIDIINTLASSLKLASEKVKKRDINNTKVDLVEDVIADRFGVEVDINNKILNEILFRRYSKPLFKHLLRRVDPNLVPLVTSYRSDNRVVVEACSELDITSVEIQHGVIHPYHLEYNFPGNRTKRIFPDYLLSWGEFWKENVEYPIKKERVLTVGYPFIDQRSNIYDDMSGDKIVFISQGTIGKRLSKFAVEVNQHPDINYDVIYKLHPGEYDRWRDEYPWLVDADFEIVDSSEPPLYEIFAESSVQVGVGSTALYEGLCFDLETYIYEGSLIMKSLIDDGAATVVSTANDLASEIEGKKSTFNRDYYFSPNGTRQITETLQRLANDSST